MGPLEPTAITTERRNTVDVALADFEEKPVKDPKVRRRRFRILDVAIVLVLVALIALSITPWPSALLIRSVFEGGAKSTIEEMLPYVPDTPMAESRDVAYMDGGTLDAFTPESAAGPLPAVVWIHGGAWISGNKTDVEPYLRILAAKGYTTISLDYPIAPETTYPAAVEDLNKALGYITEHAAELRVDPNRIVLAGDSAGAQLASQLTTLTVNPAYANLLGIKPALDKKQLAATILHCGVYDLQAMADLNGIAAWGFKISLWGYTGTKDWSDTYAGSTMSTVEFVTGDFPPTFISGGNGDGLTWLQSIPYSNRLKSAGVPVTELFFPAGHEPALPHEYQFHLDYKAAQDARDQTFDFLAIHTRP